jgi:hypothetical protein
LNQNFARTIELLIKIDSFKIFFTKVKESDAPNYSLIILNPIDLSTIKLKAKRNEYVSQQDFLGDMALLKNNAERYNGPAHEVTKLAEKL